ncbi:AmpG family muropeptide MFS transporter [Oceanicoccus sp.]|uniref:AmpG family muropeptide MFS transporter n=1 Tax=Oceanicoccus sp. TaxID=2691044 RepID=UPI00262E4077|nr:AmpG family muropeptide MFS transporter [Oceanicoccus sp.]
MINPELKQAIFNRRMLICVFTGFSSGLPLYVIIQLLQVWLRENNASLAEIGLFALVGMPYTLKFLWAPLMDRYTPPLLGRRRGWLLPMQLASLLLIGCLGMLDPGLSLVTVAYMTLALAFFSASQDVVLDAFRREILPDSELGLGNTIHVQAYRIAGLVPGSLALILADFMSWSLVFWIVAAFMLPGVAMTLWVKEPPRVEGTPATLHSAIVEPFKEFFTRKNLSAALLILAFMFFYKVGDSMATALSSVFYLDLGFTKTEIGVVAKNAGLWPMIIGGLLGGIWMIKLGINRALWIFGVVQLLSILGFAVLAEVGADLWMLAAVIAFEYLGVGLGTAAFVAFIARETDKRYAATQFALLTALTALPRTFANAVTGVIVEYSGWTNFFLLCALIAVPGMLLLFKVAPWNERL